MSVFMNNILTALYPTTQQRKYHVSVRCFGFRYHVGWVGIFKINENIILLLTPIFSHVFAPSSFHFRQC